MLERVRRDLKRFYRFESRTGDATLAEKVAILASNHALHGVLVYRFGAWVQQKATSSVLNLPLKIAHRAMDEAITVLWGMHIHPAAKIDGGLYISHPQGVLIGGATLGRDCNISHSVTIGVRPGRDEEHGTPTLGDRVFVGPGSVVFGRVTVASGAAIGPLTVVGRNLPPRCLAVGNPMQIVNKDYDNTTLIYGTRPPPA